MHSRVCVRVCSSALCLHNIRKFCACFYQRGAAKFKRTGVVVVAAAAALPPSQLAHCLCKYMCVYRTISMTRHSRTAVGGRVCARPQLRRGVYVFLLRVLCAPKSDFVTYVFDVLSVRRLLGNLKIQWMD